MYIYDVIKCKIILIIEFNLDWLFQYNKQKSGLFIVINLDILKNKWDIILKKIFKCCLFIIFYLCCFVVEMDIGCIVVMVFLR